MGTNSEEGKSRGQQLDILSHNVRRRQEEVERVEGELQLKREALNENERVCMNK